MNPPIRFDDVVIDRGAMLVTKGGARVDLEPKAFDVLVHLAERPGQLVTKAELIADVWKGIAVTDHVLTRVIGQLRRGLGDAAREARYIETVPTRGYRFIAPLGDARQAELAPMAVQTAGDRWPRAESGWPRPAVVAAGLVLLVMAAGGAWLWARQGVERAEWNSPSPGAARQLTFSPDTHDAYPDFSPDGKLIAYASSASGAFEIEVRALTPDAKPQRITNDRAGNVQPNWSPDGQYIAYHAMGPGGIWVTPALGGVPRRVVTVGASPEWSPDGREIVFQSSQPATLESGSTPPPSRLLVVSAAGGEPRPLTWPGQPMGAHSEPVWSPDGRRIAFLVRGVARVEIWNVNRTGGDPQFVWSCNGTCSRIAYEPGGSALIVSVRGRGYLWLPIDPATGVVTGEPRVLASQHADFPGHIAVSPDGRTAVMTELRVRSNLYSLALDERGLPAGEPRALTNTTGRTTTPTFSPDGRRLAFAQRRETTQVCLMDANGGEIVPLPNAAGYQMIARPAWVGDRVFAVAFGDRTSDIVAIDPVSRESKTLATLGSNDVSGNSQFLASSYFPDGQRIAFSRETPDGVGVWTMDLSTKALTRLTPPGENGTFPLASPDGRFVAFERVADGSMNVVVVPAAGGAPRQVTSGPGLTWPHSWSADGQRLFAAIRRGTSWSLASVAVADGETRVLWTEPVAHAYLRYPALSPLGRQIVFERTEITGNIWQIALWRAPERDTP